MEEGKSEGLENGEVGILKGARDKCNLEAEDEASVDAPRPGVSFPSPPLVSLFQLWPL